MADLGTAYSSNGGAYSFAPTMRSHSLVVATLPPSATTPPQLGLRLISQSGGIRS